MKRIEFTTRNFSSSAFTPNSPAAQAPSSNAYMNQSQSHSPQLKPQPRPNIPFNAGVIPHFETNNSMLPSEQEKILYEQEKEKERQAVVNQVGEKVSQLLLVPL